MWRYYTAQADILQSFSWLPSQLRSVKESDVKVLLHDPAVNGGTHRLLLTPSRSSLSALSWCLPDCLLLQPRPHLNLRAIINMTSLFSRTIAAVWSSKQTTRQHRSRLQLHTQFEESSLDFVVECGAPQKAGGPLYPQSVLSSRRLWRRRQVSSSSVRIRLRLTYGNYLL